MTSRPTDGAAEESSRVRVISTLMELREISDEWSSVLSRSAADTIFLTWEWQSTWAECFLSDDRELFVLAVYERGRLTGIAPWSIVRTRVRFGRIRQVEFLGAAEPAGDYLDVLVVKGRERLVARVLFDFLFHAAADRWDRISLDAVPASSLFLAHFLDRLDAAGKYFRVRPGAFCPTLTLPGESKEFLAELSPNRRQRYRRDWRNLNKLGRARHDSIRALGADGEVLREFCGFYRQTKWGDYAETVERFFERLLADGRAQEWVQFDFLRLDGRPLAAMLHLRYGGRVMMYLSAVDRAYRSQVSVGNALYGKCIERGIEEGFSEYDFLQGGEEYKFSWARGGTRSLELTVYQRRASAIPILGERFLRDIAKVVLR